MHEMLGRETRTQKTLRLTSLFMGVLVLLTMVLFIAGSLLRTSAETETTAPATGTETTAETSSEKGTETGQVDWSTKTVVLKDNDGFLGSCSRADISNTNIRIFFHKMFRCSKKNTGSK